MRMSKIAKTWCPHTFETPYLWALKITSPQNLFPHLPWGRTPWRNYVRYDLSQSLQVSKSPGHPQENVMLFYKKTSWNLDGGFKCKF